MVENRHRKCMERKSEWDVLPTPEQAAADAQMMSLENFAATNFSGAAVDSGLPQQTRHARRLYLGNLPSNLTEQELHDFFHRAIQEMSPTPLTEDPILSVYINPFVPRSTLLGRFYDFPFFCHRINPKGSILCSFLFVNLGVNWYWFYVGLHGINEGQMSLISNFWR
jgi:hypothetical protein